MARTLEEAILLAALEGRNDAMEDKIRELYPNERRGLRKTLGFIIEVIEEVDNA